MTSDQNEPSVYFFVLFLACQLQHYPFMFLRMEGNIVNLQCQVNKKKKTDQVNKTLQK